MLLSHNRVTNTHFNGPAAFPESFFRPMTPTEPEELFPEPIGHCGGYIHISDPSLPHYVITDNDHPQFVLHGSGIPPQSKWIHAAPGANGVHAVFIFSAVYGLLVCGDNSHGRLGVGVVNANNFADGSVFHFTSPDLPEEARMNVTKVATAGNATFIITPDKTYVCGHNVGGCLTMEHEVDENILSPVADGYN